jgi:hypothetical protein
MEVFMNLTKDVIFNTNDLYKNSFVKLTYVGSLMKKSTKSLYAHIGYGDAWDNIMDVEMSKVGIGYELLIQLPSSYDSINFAFRNNNGEWDNNLNNNFSFKLINNVSENVFVKVTESDLVSNALVVTNSSSKKFKLLFMKIAKYLPRILFGKSNFDKVKN